MSLTRRDFLKACGAGAAMLTVGANVAPQVLTGNAKTVPVYPQAGNGILIDASRCVGCRSCQNACKVANNLPTNETPVGLSATTLTFVEMKNISQDPKKPVIKPVKMQCMHCEEPSCASVCPVGAFEKTPSGAVQYDADKCIGCRYCMMACPFGAPKYNWDSASPKINKCSQSCMADGKRNTPACVQACPSRALYYGPRDELLTIARDRIAQAPDKYVHHIYGEHEVGGTAMLYLSATPFEQLGFRMDLPHEAKPNYTWNVQSKIPAVFASALALLSGIAWWTHRHEAGKLTEAPVRVTNK
ncbi:MAG: 4Fe-4S binding protein [Chloroflexi bacterium]|nr:4Fe-4S binding protein [Chloroflexota bacterium]